MEQLINNKNEDKFVDVDGQNFMSEVIESSESKPVIVQFWAPWCGPCKQLGPVLEKIVNETDNVKLARVNIDENQEIAAQMRVQSVPTVYGIVQGKPVDGFAGAQPESNLREFVKKLTDNAPGEIDIKPIIEEANLKMNQKEFDNARELFEQVLSLKEDSVEAISGLIKTHVFQKDYQSARKIIDNLNKDQFENDLIKETIVSLELGEKAESSIGEIENLKEAYNNNKDDLQTNFKLALALYANNEIEHSINILLESIKKDVDWDEGAAKKQLLEIFSALGFNNPDVIKGRRKLSSILFS